MLWLKALLPQSMQRHYRWHAVWLENLGSMAVSAILTWGFYAFFGHNVSWGQWIATFTWGFPPPFM